MTNSINNGILPGYSKKYKDPEILEGVKKWKNSTRIFMLILIAAAVIICGILAKSKNNSEYIIVGIVVSALFLAILVVNEIKSSLKKQFDGVVTDKFIKEKYYYDHNDNSATRKTTLYHYLKIRTDDGKTKKIRLDGELFYHYLNVNDKVRFHPQLNGYFEKYDKSHDEYIICAACFAKNPTENERCENCNVPLLK